jgi:hypothetical protein
MILWSRLGIGGRLVSAFAGIIALSAVSGTVGWLDLRDVASTQTTVTERAMPAALQAREIAEASARLIAASPLLTNATTEDQRRKEASALFAGAQNLRALLADVQGYGFDAAKRPSSSGSMRSSRCCDTRRSWGLIFQASVR